MASGGKKKDEDASGSGWGTGLAIGAGGIALGAGLLWGFKKLMETTPDDNQEKDYAYNEDKLKEADSYEDSYSSLPQGLDNEHTGEYPEKGSKSPTKFLSGIGTVEASSSLHEQLDEYYKKYVDIDEMDMEKARAEVEVIKNHFADYIKKKLEDVEVEMVDSGSTSEGLKVVAPDEFDVMLVVDGNKLLRQISYERPHVTPGQDHFDDAGGFYFIELGQPERDVAHSKKSWPKMAKWVQNNMLSPVLARREFQGLSAQFFSQYNGHSIATSVGGPAVTVKVPYGPGKKLTIDFVPAYRFGSDIFVAKPHPKTNNGTPCDEKYLQLWRKSFSRQEGQLVDRMHKGGCHTKCLKILKAIRVFHPSEFGNMSSYVFKTLLFKMYYEDPDWPEEELAEHFIDALTKLHQCLEDGELINYFDKNMNLMTYIRPRRLDHAKNYIQRVKKRSAWQELLQVKQTEM